MKAMIMKQSFCLKPIKRTLTQCQQDALFLRWSAD
jgi:hypothetical protein